MSQNWNIILQDEHSWIFWLATQYQAWMPLRTDPFLVISFGPNLQFPWSNIILKKETLLSLLPSSAFKMPSERGENEGIIALVGMPKEKLLLRKKIEFYALPLAPGKHGLLSCQPHHVLLSPP